MAKAAPRQTRRISANKPTLLAGIDIGSTAVRMNISEVTGDERPRVVEELSHPISTGADTFRHGYILPETMRSITTILSNFLRLTEDYGVGKTRVVASSAVREASNSEILIDRIHHSSGLEMEILDAVEESRFAYQALLPWLQQHPHSYSVALNLGGGSTEIMICRGEDLQMGGARRLGTSRLMHTAGGVGVPATGEMLQAMAANIVNSTRESYQEYNVSQLFLINRLLFRAFRGDPAARRGENDFILESERLRERLRKAHGMSYLEIGRHFNMGLSDVELLIPAMVILDAFISVSEVAEITFTNTEMLSGLLVEMSMTLRGENPLMSFHRQVVRSARAVGEQYFYDRSHSRAVTEFSLVLFDSLRDMLDFSDQDRVLLEIAAVLHDIGMYVSELEHQSHSAYLIQWSDIVGLNENDRYLVSRIAYFHREEMPINTHPELISLSLDDRIRVRKLAGVLRLADVLDRGHAQGVKKLEVEITEDRLILYLQMIGDLGLILDALPKKVDILEQVTGLEVVLRREMPKA